ncbi:hypothetical protein V2J09_024125 [Rumex salicifolius]
MASKPGILTNWPWAPFGNFKYLILAPWSIHSIYSYMTKGDEADSFYLLIFPFLLLRMLHNQFWISLSRYRNAKGTNLIIILNGILFYGANWFLEGAKRLPVWRTDGVILTALLHVGPVEFLYYWLHRALHHHYLYSRYHSHHHSSIVTEPITSALTRTVSLSSSWGYVFYIDLMNNMGHCNFEHIPKYHSLHHTQFRTNYSLFMPFYDYVYGTMDQSTDRLYDTSLKKPRHSPDVVYLTHLTTPQSIYQSRLGFASLASNPLSPKWYLWLMWPITTCSMILSWVCGRTFVVEMNTFDKLRLQTWLIPRFSVHYSIKWQREAISRLVEEAILEADDKNVKSEELNLNSEVYIRKYPKLKVKLVDGSSLAVAVILNSIPKETTAVFFNAKLNKIAYSIVLSLCHKGIQTWLVDEDLTENEQFRASKETVFIPISQIPPRKRRKDCVYLHTPAMLAPNSLGNLHSCENWLPRKAMSAWRVAGIIHAMEGWNVNECGETTFDIDTVWKASLSHGFRPLSPPATSP